MIPTDRSTANAVVFASSIRQRQGLQAHIAALRLSPTGKCVVSVGNDHLVHLSSVVSGGRDQPVALAHMASLSGHRGSGVLDADFTPDGLMLVTGATDTSIRVWGVSGCLAAFEGHPRNGTPPSCRLYFFFRA